MINKSIIDKLKTKCYGDEVMYNFLYALIQKEDEGGQHTKTYTKEIENAVKEAKQYEV